MSGNTPPKHALIASARAKADEFVAKNDKSGRARAKQAILQELNNQMQIRADKMRIIGRATGSHDENAKYKER